jgi:hypothetical protein
MQYIRSRYQYMKYGHFLFSSAPDLSYNRENGQCFRLRFPKLSHSDRRPRHRPLHRPLPEITSHLLGYFAGRATLTSIPHFPSRRPGLPLPCNGCSVAGPEIPISYLDLPHFPNTHMLSLFSFWFYLLYLNTFALLLEKMNLFRRVSSPHRPGSQANRST